jgi:hypothetical protein
MLLHFVLYNLAISLLNSGEIGLSLLELIFPVKYQSFSTLNSQFNLSHNVRNYIEFRGAKIILLDALSTK